MAEPIGNKTKWALLLLLLAAGLGAFFLLKKKKSDEPDFDIESTSHVPPKSKKFDFVTITVNVINNGAPGTGNLRFFRKSTGKEINAGQPKPIPFLNNGEKASIQKALAQEEDNETIIVQAENDLGNITNVQTVLLSSA